MQNLSNKDGIKASSLDDDESQKENREIDNILINYQKSHHRPLTERKSFVSTRSSRKGNVSFRNLDFKTKNNKEESDSEDYDDETNPFRMNRNKFKRNDSRFVNLIEIIKPVYNMNEEKDMNEIIKSNQALKTTSLLFLREQQNKSRKINSRLVMSAKRVLLKGEISNKIENFLL